MLKISALVGVELTNWQINSVELAMPFPNARIAGRAKFSAIAWVPVVVAKPVTTSRRVVAAPTFFALKKAH
jgi:hypothetical protein